MVFWRNSVGGTSNSVLLEVGFILEQFPQRVTSLNGRALTAAHYEMVTFQATHGVQWNLL